MGDVIEFRNRVQPGVPTGGQFAPTTHAEGDVELTADDLPDQERPDYGVDYDGPDQSHIRVFDDGRGGHLREDGQRGYTCKHCGNGYATQRGASGHDCTELENLSDRQMADLAVQEAWQGIPPSNGDTYYRAHYDIAAASIVANFPSAPGFEALSGTTRLKKAPTGEMYEPRTGAKYTEGYRPLTEITKDVRADIKTAVKTGILPSHYNGRDISYSVAKSGGAINIRISGMRDDDIYDSERQPPFGDRRQSQLARDITNRASNIAAAYNQSRTESQVDYFDETYYSFVRISDERDVAWDLHDKAQTKAKAEINKLKREGAPRDVIEEKIVQYRSANDRKAQSDKFFNDKDRAERDAWSERERAADAVRQAAIDARKAGL